MRRERFGLNDTSESSEKTYTEVLRKLSAERKLQMVLEHMRFGREMKKLGAQFKNDK